MSLKPFFDSNLRVDDGDIAIRLKISTWISHGAKVLSDALLPT